MPRKTPRRHQQGDQLRKRILETTLEIAAEHGYDGTTVALVTERTGLPASSVYWHFKNKDELLAETLEFSYRQWRESTPTWSAGGAPDDLGEEIRERPHTASPAGHGRLRVPGRRGHHARHLRHRRSGLPARRVTSPRGRPWTPCSTPTSGS